MASYPAQAQWTALPHSKMSIENTVDEQNRGAAPVNHRFQSLVADRAGSKPRAAWFERDNDQTVTFPRLLVREDWQHESAQDLCQRYLARKAPRLLMLQGLLPEDRQRLEIAAKKHPFEVEEYFRLYPETYDQRLMAAIRVEARLRRNAPQQPKVPEKTDAQKDKRLSKDMRIFET